eukprot:3577729-Alexandrium_andersonii.AAC.1
MYSKADVHARPTSRTHHAPIDVPVAAYDGAPSQRRPRLDSATDIDNHQLHDTQQSAHEPR